MSTRCTALVVCGIALIAGADSDLVRKHVQTGLQKYQRGEFTAAARAFQDADLLQPGDPIIEFNRGCAEARARNREGAKVLLKSAALSDDPQVAAAAHYNLGCIEALAARGIFEVSAREASKADRKRGLARLTKSIRHYRDCLAVQPEHKEARRNIEIIRMWTANMRREWARRDRQRDEQQPQSPEEISLPLFLDRLDGRQHTAMDVVLHDAEAVGFDLQSLTELQQGVGASVPKLREKIDAHLQVPDDLPEEQAAEFESARQRLHELANQLIEASDIAAAELPDGDIEKCLPGQAAALDHINAMYEMVVAFPQLVLRALRIQELNQTRNQLLINDRRRRQLVSPTISGGNFLSERQSRVAGLAQKLLERAAAFEQRIESASSAPADEEAIAGLRTAIERAKEYGPRIQELTTDATRLLADDRYRDAIVLQKEAFELLSKIAETLPRQKGGSEDEGQENAEPDPTQVGENELGESDDENRKKQQQKEKQQQQQREREEAEALLRRVRDREQNLRELKAQLRAMRARRSNAERDW